MDTITPAEFRAAPGTEAWQVDEGGASVTFRTRDFATGARLFNAIAELAEAASHHPDVDIRYPSVRVHLFTHSAHGLTAKDAALAEQISAAAASLDIRPLSAPEEPTETSS